MIERKTSMILMATILAGTILSGTTAMETSDLGSQTALDEELIVFCGAGFTGAMSEIGEIYGNSSNAQVRFNFDGLPALRVQIEEGAYADILISPDQSYMDPLVEEGFIDEESVQVFASNKVAVVLPVNNPANITTIHGFCSGLLRANPLEAGLDPNFSVMEEWQSSRLLQEAMRSACEQILQSKDSGLELLLLEHSPYQLIPSFAAFINSCAIRESLCSNWRKSLRQRRRIGR